MKQDYEQLNVFFNQNFQHLPCNWSFLMIKKRVHKFRFVQTKILSKSDEFIGNQSICN